MLKENNKIVYTLIIIIILLLSIIDYFFGIKYFGSIYGYIVKPSLWLMLFIVIYFLFRRTKLTPGKHKKDINFIMIVLTITYFLIFFSLGYIKGFNISVYNKTLSGIFINLYSIVPIILVKEYLRLYMVNNLTRHKKAIKLILISILLFIPDINLSNFLSDFETNAGSLQFLFATLIPKLSISFFLTFTIYYSHNLIAYFYLLFPITLNFIIPYLPNIDWFLEGMLTTSFVFMGFLMINSQILKNNQQKENPVTVQEFRNSWTIPTIILSIYIPFMASFLFIKPVVIASNSMYPIFNKGDIVIIKTVTPNEKSKNLKN